MTERYEPTVEERTFTQGRGDCLRVSGDGFFATLQGEGVTAGRPVVFMRLHDCNLQCGLAGKGWRCDTWYTWDKTTPEYWRESLHVPVERATDTINQLWEAKHSEVEDRRLVISGGEPLLQQSQIRRLLPRLPNWQVEIETNGTVLPHTDLKTVQLNCSPKLATSGNAQRARYRPRVLQRIATFPNSWFKFVIADEDQDIAELTSIVETNSLDYARVLLMSEGSDREKLIASDRRLEDIATSLGCGITKRNHIFWFGDKRRT